MRLSLTRNMHKEGPQKGQYKVGCTDTFTATIDGAERCGIGKSRTEAIGSLVSANLEFFGIDERMDNDPTSETPVCTWKTGDRARAAGTRE